MRYIPDKGKNILDFASGPIQYREYLQYSKKFKLRHCVDFSRDAINLAHKKLGKRGKYYCNDFLKINFKENFFDCALSLHTIYHIDKKIQKKVILKLIKITKKKSPIIIVYSNPNNLISKIRNLMGYKIQRKKIYFYCHDIKWWDQFKKYGSVNLFPWRSFASQHQKFLFPNNIVGYFFLKVLYALEDNFKKFFINNFQYYTVVIKKNNS